MIHAAAGGPKLRLWGQSGRKCEAAAQCTGMHHGQKVEKLKISHEDPLAFEWVSCIPWKEKEMGGLEAKPGSGLAEPIPYAVRPICLPWILTSCHSTALEVTLPAALAYCSTRCVNAGVYHCEELVMYSSPRPKWKNGRNRNIVPQGRRVLDRHVLSSLRLARH